MMRSLAMLLVGLACLAPNLAQAGPPQSFCCACRPFDVAQQGLGGPAQAPPPVPALFCSAAASREATEALVDRCVALDETAKLVCYSNGVTSCFIELADNGIACPAGTGAPLLSPWALAGLALALGAGGVAIVRRRTTVR